MTDDRPAKQRHRKKKSLDRRIRRKLRGSVGQEKVLYIIAALILAIVAGYFVLKYIAIFDAE